MTAMMLDARHKHLGFLMTSERLAANAKLHKMASVVVLTGSPTENANSGVTQSVQQVQAGGDDGKRAFGCFSKVITINSVSMTQKAR